MRARPRARVGRLIVSVVVGPGELVINLADDGARPVQVLISARGNPRNSGLCLISRLQMF
jgi:hypothetical protein